MTMIIYVFTTQLGDLVDYLRKLFKDVENLLGTTIFHPLTKGRQKLLSEVGDVKGEQALYCEL